ncbi:SGNH/GDSL hydrolase family protein [Rhodococcus sp. IEGM 1370]|uniref:SGNH/GDSL hydrolase family protein n=1 Tax=Rhodococcus sp. IEGM 1370 TaxID=3082222 RepID=UPI002955A1DC|nr:SGNH/GDSL hydrolase family protein [Rhodococcus sp. IEGM 1370]MDV8077559.1 SGNH/GDSL hydrolase family protein [Rhodococcus sp. IEGM 1370]
MPRNPLGSKNVSFGLSALASAVAVLLVVCFAIYAGITSLNRDVPGGDAVRFAQPGIGGGRTTSAVFVGDSYTEGVGSSSESLRWTSQVSADMGWYEINLGVGGTGYLNAMESSDCQRASCSAYRDQVGIIAQFSPSVVVVAGGQNDMAAMLIDPSVVELAVQKTYREIRRALPNVQIVAVGPSFPTPAEDVETEAGRLRLDRAVRSAADEASGVYVSLMDPSVISPSMILPDMNHVNDIGHRAIADRVVSVLLRE